jgi:hypothetical protein
LSRTLSDSGNLTRDWTLHTARSNKDRVRLVMLYALRSP